MERNIKRLSAMLMCILTLLVFGAGYAFAQDGNSENAETLLTEISTNKAVYAVGEKAQVNIKVSNNTSSDFPKVNIFANLPSSLKLDDGQTACVDIDLLEAGKTYNALSFTATVVSPLTDTGDTLPLALLVGAVLVCFSLIVICTVKGKSKALLRTLSVVLCFSLLCGFLGVFSPALAADDENTSFMVLSTAQKSVKINGNDEEISAVTQMNIGSADAQSVISETQVFSNEKVANGSEYFSIVLQVLENEFSTDITSQMLTLSGGFDGLCVESIEFLNNTVLLLNVNGTVPEDATMGKIKFAYNAFKEPISDICANIDIVDMGVEFIISSMSFDSATSVLTLPVSLNYAVFSDNVDLSPDDFATDKFGVSVTQVTRLSPTAVELKISVDGAADIDNAVDILNGDENEEAEPVTLTLSDRATNCGEKSVQFILSKAKAEFDAYYLYSEATADAANIKRSFSFFIQPQITNGIYDYSNTDLDIAISFLNNKASVSEIELKTTDEFENAFELNFDVSYEQSADAKIVQMLEDDDFSFIKLAVSAPAGSLKNLWGTDADSPMRFVSKITPANLGADDGVFDGIVNYLKAMVDVSSSSPEMAELLKELGKGTLSAAAGALVNVAINKIFDIPTMSDIENHLLDIKATLTQMTTTLDEIKDNQSAVMNMFNDMSRLIAATAATSDYSNRLNDYTDLLSELQTQVEFVDLSDYNDEFDTECYTVEEALNDCNACDDAATLQSKYTALCNVLKDQLANGSDKGKAFVMAVNKLGKIIAPSGAVSSGSLISLFDKAIDANQGYINANFDTQTINIKNCYRTLLANEYAKYVVYASMVTSVHSSSTTMKTWQKALSSQSGKVVEAAKSVAQPANIYCYETGRYYSREMVIYEPTYAYSHMGLNPTETELKKMGANASKRNATMLYDLVNAGFSFYNHQNKTLYSTDEAKCKYPAATDDNIKTYLQTYFSPIAHMDTYLPTGEVSLAATIKDVNASSRYEYLLQKSIKLYGGGKGLANTSLASNQGVTAISQAQVEQYNTVSYNVFSTIYNSWDYLFPDDSINKYMPASSRASYSDTVAFNVAKSWFYQYGETAMMNKIRELNLGFSSPDEIRQIVYIQKNIPYYTVLAEANRGGMHNQGELGLGKRAAIVFAAPTV